MPKRRGPRNHLTIEEMTEDMRKETLREIVMGPIDVIIGHRIQLVLEKAVEVGMKREKEAYNRGYGDGLTGKEPNP